MKKTIGLMLSTSILLGLTACGGGSKPNDGSKTPVDPAQLTYDGKTELVDLTQLDEQQRNDLAAKFVEFQIANEIPEIVFMSGGLVLHTLHEQLNLDGMSAGTQSTVDFKNIAGYCGGTGSLKISSDFNQSNSAIKSYSEIRANAGTIDWKLNNLCKDLDSNSQLNLTADFKETYRTTTNSNDLNLKTDYETDSLKVSCEYKFAASTAKTEIGDELLKSASFKCQDAIGKLALVGNTGDAIFQLNSGEKIFYDWSEDEVLALSSFGKFGFQKNPNLRSCYDAQAKVNRIKSGSYYLWTLTYDQSTDHYTEDSEKAYLVTVSQPDSTTCGKPNITVVKAVPEL